MTTTPPPFIEVKNVSKAYRRGQETIAALHDVSFVIRKGEIVAITGPSGSGKTTLVQIVGGLVPPDMGSVMVSGKKLNTKSDKHISHYRNRQVGFVFQNFSLIPRYTAAENVMVPLVVAQVPRRSRRPQAEHVLRAVGLEKRANHPIDKLSGGERQRVAIARALVNSPQIIIADEPTGNLDSANGREIMAILESLAHKFDISVLLVTHDDRLAARADRIIRITDGEMGEG